MPDFSAFPLEPPAQHEHADKHTAYHEHMTVASIDTSQPESFPETLHSHHTPPHTGLPTHPILPQHDDFDAVHHQGHTLPLHAPAPTIEHQSGLPAFPPAARTLPRDHFVFFWRDSEIDTGLYCQWFPSHLTDGRFQYTCCEMYMMAAKARVFKVCIDVLLCARSSLGTYTSLISNIVTLLDSFARYANFISTCQSR